MCKVLFDMECYERELINTEKDRNAIKVAITKDVVDHITIGKFLTLG